MKKARRLATLTLLTLLPLITPSRAYPKSSLLTGVKKALSSCDVNAYFKIKSAGADANSSTRDEIAHYFLERVKSKSQCDSYEALLGLEELVPERAAFAFPELANVALAASQEKDLLNGPQPRLDLVISALRAIFRSNPDSRGKFFEAIAAPATSEPRLLLISAASGSLTKLDSPVRDKIRKLWHEAMAMNEEQVNQSRFSSYVKEARINLADLTNEIFQEKPVDEMIAAIQSSSDREFRTSLIRELKGIQPPLAADILRRVDTKRLNPTEKIALYFNENSAAAKDSLAALYQTYKSSPTHACKFGNTEFQIEEAIPGKQYANDHFFPEEETAYWLRVKDRVLPLVGTWNLSDAPVGIVKAGKDQSTACKDYAVFVNGPVLVLPVLVDNRPFGVALSIVLFDFEKMKVLDTILPSGGETSADLPVTESQGGYLFTLRLQPSDSAEEDKIKIRDKTADKVLDGILETVYRLDLKDRKWVIHVDIDQTWGKFPYSKFFASKEAFANAFELSGEQTRDSSSLHPVDWVRVATKDGKPFCIYPSKTRNRPTSDDGWICLN
jgi:hypothetical protein